MATQNAAGQDYLNNADGWQLGGGTTKRTLTLTAGSVTITGGTSTLSLAGNLTTSGTSAITITSTGTTNVTLPTSGVLEAVAKATRVDTTGSYTLTTANVIALANCAGGTITYTLPAASGNGGQRYYIKKTDSSANAVTINRAGADTIDGQTSQVIRIQYQCLMLVSDGTSAWYII